MRHGPWRGPGARNAWVVLVAAALVVIAVFTVTRAPSVPKDTIDVLRGAAALRICFDEGVLAHCADYLGRRGVPVGEPYPLYQHVPAYVMLVLGASAGTVFRGLQLLNLAAFAGLAVLMGLVGRRTGRAWAAPLLVLVAIGGPLAWYAWSTFGEVLAVALITALAAAALLRAPPWLLLVLAWMAGTTKETAPPFTFAIAAIALAATPLARRPARRAHWIALVAGTLLALASNLALNVLRFGQVVNPVYTAPLTQVPGVGLKARFALSLWAAPNGGTAFFWPSVTLVIAGLLFAVARRDRRALPAAGLLVLVALHTGLLASWWSPFGWVAWGPRLMLPLLPAFALLAVVIYPEVFEGAVRRIAAAPWARVALAAAFAVATLPQAGVMTDSAAITRLFTVDPTDPHCPRGARISSDPGGYYSCVIDVAWRRPSLLVDASGGIAQDEGPLIAVLLAGSAAGCVLAATRRPRAG